MPVLLINDELYELIDNKLFPVDTSILVFNYYFENSPNMAYIFVVTRKGFPAFIERMINLEETVEQNMINIRKGVA